MTHDQNWPPQDYTQYVVEASALNRNGQGPALSYHEWKDRQHDRTQSRINEVECPNCKGQGEVRGPQSNMPWFICRLCNGSGVVTEQQSRDWPPR